MGRLSFDSVDVLIYDPVSSNRTATRSAMYSLGFRKTETVSTLQDFVQAVQTCPPDIALCEAQGAADELCDVIQQLRQGSAGTDKGNHGKTEQQFPEHAFPPNRRKSSSAESRRKAADV